MATLGCLIQPKRSDVTLVGKVTNVGSGYRDSEVTEVLGWRVESEDRHLVADHSIHLHWSDSEFAVGEEALVLGRKAEGDRLNLDVSGGGK